MPASGAVEPKGKHYHLTHLTVLRYREASGQDKNLALVGEPG